jgi:hypothetical protein
VTRVKSLIGGRKSSPMPSTIHEALLVESVPSLMYWVRIEPTGSARMNSTSGAFSAKQRDSPVIVPDEPQPNTIASSRPSIWARISGPVPVSCASGLSGLPNWLMKYAPGVSRASRSAMSW